ncbi:hypothetical protein NEUTE1DRAFT_131811 [Neurospora tetrasperma FGSC 2508]|uniref:Uncharacterized protein n=1 Tax=Neurospora tetrasperma (strain FGSC 2508 / ATCC MYA-4615 / P0657) TaxID=510951 RepID=F8MWT6_NEUT8|nr:uncharacterized protein NEUTE1DRAFT_131811 [Neurospora tetrasperma FGSC 2508]EGO54207.1 hypothetical protein NEUTE1DRAFT_131811 [Neurospora tetrasperma FGSC 2508]EGZ68361.1 hypothetical protein NEUTE2DRAFT_141985 [Neurospora tetrasperma FGSC 2509]
MQPFLSGETTLALLLTVLTLLFFAAAGDEHPYEPYHHSNLPLPAEAGRSSVVDLASCEQPQIQRKQELVIRLEESLQRRVTAKEEEHHQRKSAEVEMMMKKPRGAISFQANTTTKPPRLSTSTSTFITSRLLRPPRNLQILAALLSHGRRRSLLHTATAPLSTVLLKSSGAGAADMSWLLEALLGLWLVLPLATTKKTSSLRCPTRSKRRKSVKFVAVGGGGHDEVDLIGGQQQLGQKRQRETCGGSGGEETDEIQQQQQLQDLGLGLTRSVGERVVMVC